MKKSLLKALPVVVLFTLVGCTTYNGPSEIERSFYKECAMTPPQSPCGHY